MSLLNQLQEQVRHFLSQEQSRACELSVAINENIYFREELQTAQQKAADCDREIGRLRGDALHLSTSSSPIAPMDSRVSPLKTLVGQAQEEGTGQGVATENSGSVDETASEVRTVPRFVSRAPLYDHFLPDQRIIPRSRQAPPSKARHSITNGRLHIDQEAAQEEDSYSHESEWQQDPSSQEEHDITSARLEE